MYYNIKRKEDVIAPNGLRNNITLNARPHTDFPYFVEFGLCFTTNTRQKLHTDYRSLNYLDFYA